MHGTRSSHRRTTLHGFRLEMKVDADDLPVAGLSRRQIVYQTPCENFTSPLETFSRLPNFFVAVDAVRVPSGPFKAGAGQVSGAGSYPTCSLEDLAMRYDWTPLWRSTIGL